MAFCHNCGFGLHDTLNCPKNIRRIEEQDTASNQDSLVMLYNKSNVVVSDDNAETRTERSSQINHDQAVLRMMQGFVLQVILNLKLKSKSRPNLKQQQQQRGKKDKSKVAPKVSNKSITPTSLRGNPQADATIQKI